MRRLILLIALLLIPMLTACGGKPPVQPTPAVVSQPAGQVATTPVANLLASGGGATQLTMTNLGQAPTADGRVFFKAEVVNAGQTEARPQTITIELLDDAGQRVTRTSFTNLGLPALKPGEKAAWQGYIGKPPSAWKAVRATAASK